MVVNLFSRLPWGWGKSERNRASQNPTNLTALTRIQQFSWNKCSLDYCKALANFQDPAKVDFDLFFDHYYFFIMEEWILDVFTLPF